MLRGKRIVLGVTGSIAAYKSALIVREFVKAGAEVQVVLSDAARDFITPLTLATLSKRPVLYRFSDDAESGEWNNHVDIGLWADALIIAPCSANTLAKMRQGTCDNLLMAIYLSARCDTYIAPAMDLDMYAHSSTQENITHLAEAGVKIIYPQSGELASGLSGQGRMTEPEDIRDFLSYSLSQGLSLKGKRVLITAGPTYEDLDPVRFLGNRSTGTMGFAIADIANSLGAQVILVAGPVHQTTPHDNIERINVRSAADMLQVCTEQTPRTDILIMAAAVADYRPATLSSSKIKKQEGEWALELERTTDIIATLGKSKTASQYFVGFALETDDALANAERKLQKKNLDLIVLNSLKDAGAGFGRDTNRVTLIGKGNDPVQYELKSKQDVAWDILRTVIESQT